MHVDQRAGRDRLRCKADDLSVLAHRLARVDVGQRDLVAQPDRFANLDRSPAQSQREAARNRPGRHGHRVVASQDDGLGIIDCRRHLGAPVVSAARENTSQVSLENWTADE